METKRETKRAKGTREGGEEMEEREGEGDEGESVVAVLFASAYRV